MIKFKLKETNNYVESGDIVNLYAKNEIDTLSSLIKELLELDYMFNNDLVIFHHDFSGSDLSNTPHLKSKVSISEVGSYIRVDEYDSEITVQEISKRIINLITAIRSTDYYANSDIGFPISIVFTGLYKLYDKYNSKYEMLADLYDTINKLKPYLMRCNIFIYIIWPINGDENIDIIVKGENE